MSYEANSALERDAIRRCQNGEREAFRLLFHAHSTHLYRVALLITRDPYLAEDATQDCLLSAWKKIRSFKPGTDFRAWLNRILINSIGMIRRRKQLPTAPEGLALTLPTGEGSPEQAALDSDTAGRLQKALGQLSVEHSTVLVFRYFNDMSIYEIAESTGWREGTVKSRLSRAQSALREVLASGPDLNPSDSDRKVVRS